MKKSTILKSQKVTSVKPNPEPQIKKTRQEKQIKAEAIKEVRIVDDAKWW